MLYVFENTENFDVPDAVRNSDHTVVDACLNLEDLQAFREQFPAHADADDFDLKLH